MIEITLKSIGVIKTPYKEPKNIPIQGCFDADVEAICVLDDIYKDGLKDLDGFSHAILIYYFHKAKETKIVAQPFLEPIEHGVFSIRSPSRPNKIGFTVVKISRIIENELYFTDVDMLNDTPLLDIKPFVKQFDNRENTKAGWIDKHFKNGNIPSQTILK